MNEELAKYIIRTAFNSSSELNNLIPLLKEQLQEHEYKELGLAIASITADINLKILKRIFKEFPEFENEIEDSITRYGRLIL